MKLKVFPKIFLITFITILTTILLFFYIFRLFFANYLAYYNEQAFHKIETQLVSEVTGQSVSDLMAQSYFEKFERKHGVSINLLIGDDTVYPQFLSIMENPNNNHEGDSSFVAITGDDFDAIHFFWSDGVQYTLKVVYPSGISENDFFSVFSSILPFMIVLGFLVSLLISYLYARHNERKIKHLNGIMNEMAVFEYDGLRSPVEGDEFSQLENQIDAMYRQMTDAMHKSRKFAKDRELFLKGSVHELKTPMMSMSLRIEALLFDESLDEHQLKMVYDMQHKINHMSKLVHEILSISKLESILNEATIQPHMYLEEVVEIHRYLLEDKMMEVEIEFDTSQIRMSETDFMKVASNLLGNAIKYGCESSTINVHYQNRRLRIENYRMNVIDPTKDLLKPFVQGHDSTDGESHGLGLYVVAMIAHKYDYGLTVDSSGERFVVQLDFNTDNSKNYANDSK
ncbi:HAMP domain-containing histidine kinase [Erysipelothrix sp. HDW6C]|uniref:sensor histidine kinase n=1 Tax=Erysipelothrix sp. HDW6C TaxID=2714930 RepID=UPI00140B9A58|nr:HAMP domain-containing sensor histidine kinase [Erysipelothrix sp. HDW6C]QIK69373.1 HAMP domain-containing histidine kinase [Erysipelothrix sp. HDW6C]